MWWILLQIVAIYTYSRNTDRTCWAVVHGDHYVTGTFPGAGIDWGCMVDSERLSSRMSFQLENKVLDTSEP